jgi:TolB-like protein/Tfp pilus assembly protein PilF
MDVLVILAEHASEVVTRDELFDAVWHGQVVSDERLTHTIAELRRALQDDPGAPKYIETVPKRGYRLIGHIRLPDGSKLGGSATPFQPVTRLNGRNLGIVAIALLLLVPVYIAFDTLVSVNDACEKSIAVLPFVNTSGDPDQEYFSDGLSDTLIHVLAQVSGLKVTAKTSSFYFKGKNIDVGEIARELNVCTILEGSVQRAGNRVRVIAQLVNAEEDTHLWSKTFDRDLEDIFVVQDEIAQEVVKALKVTLLDAEEERLAQRYQPTLEVYEQLILGRYEMGKRTATSLTAAEQYFKKAIELDPDYVLPYVDLSETYGHQVIHGGLLFEESLQRRQPLVEKALELDPLSAEAHLGRAILHSRQRIKTGEENSSAVEEGVLKAIELNPNYALAHQWHSGLLYGKGRYEEALAQIRVAAGLDPMSPTIQTEIAEDTWAAGRAEEALTQIRRNVERNPEFPNNYSVMAGFQTQLGHLGEAQRWIREARRRNPEDAYSWWFECVGFLNLDDALSAEDCAKQLSEAHPEKVVSRSMLWVLPWYRGEWKAAIATLEYLSERVPGFRPFDRLLAELIARQGDVERARRLMADVVPELLEDGLELAVSDLNAAVVFAAILHANGETRQRDILLLAMEERIATMHRTRGLNYGILDVYIHVMRGDRDLAIAALREAIDVGWRVSGARPLVGCWWMLRQDWKLGNLRQDPEFIAMVNELEADIRRQRQWYEKNKDKPLL